MGGTLQPGGPRHISRLDRELQEGRRERQDRENRAAVGDSTLQVSGPAGFDHNQQTRTAG